MMDSFHSEALTSDSSSPDDSISHIQKKARTRKARRTEDLISVNICETQKQDPKQTGKRQRHNISFLPKIDLKEDIGPLAVIKTNTFKQSRPSLKKRRAIFKIGRSMIEGKQFQGQKANISRSKFPKIILNLTKKKKHMGQENSKKPKKSEELVQVLSDTVEEFHSESTIKIKDPRKHKSKSLPHRRGPGNNEAPWVMKDLYVNLVPLEKTNFLNTDQMMQLKAKWNITSPFPVRDASFNKRNSGLSRTKTATGKENRYKAETSKDLNLATKSILCPGGIIPCTVGLERLPLEEIRLLASPKETHQENFNADELIPEDVSSSDSNKSSIFAKSTPSKKCPKSFDEQINSSLSKSSRRHNKSPRNCEESFFNPLGSSSPFVYLQKLATKLTESNTLLLSSPTNKRVTYELEEKETQRTHLNNLACGAELKNKSATFEVEDGFFTSQYSAETNAEPSTSEKKSTSSTSNKTYQCDLEIDVQKKRSNFSGAADLSDCILSKNTSRCEKRSTLTLEDTVNDVVLLKSRCDSSGAPTLLHKPDQPDYSNITLRKHQSPNWENKESMLENISPPWNKECSSSEGTFEINKMDDFKILPSSFGEAEVEAEQTPSTSAVSLSKRMQKSATLEDGIIEISDEESDEASFSTTTSSESSGAEKYKNYLPKQGRRVTFETDLVKRGKQNLCKVPSTPKSMIKKNNSSNMFVPKSRRVTFSDVSVIIVDDSPRCDDSPVRKSISTVVRTNLPSDDEESPQLNKTNKVDWTPIHKRVESHKLNMESSALTQTQGCYQSPRTNSIGRKPMQLQSHIDSPRFNKRGTVGRTPLQLKLPAEDDQVSYSLPKMNKRISSGERVKLQNDSLTSSVIKKNNNTGSKKSRMPDFASIHKKLFDKMVNLEEYSKHKEQRAKLLLSGRKPAEGDSYSKESSSKQLETNSHKKISSKKRLYYEEPSTSTALPNKRNVKKALLVSSTPKPDKNQKTGYTRYGFKIDRDITKKQQLIAVANKTKPQKSTTAENRSVIKGVRSNRRFDLLMKLRQKQQK